MSASINQAAFGISQSAIAAPGRPQITTAANRLKDDKSSASDTTVNLGQSIRPDLQLYSVATVQATAKAASSESTGGPTVSAGSIVAGKGAITVDVLASDSGYENKIYYSTDNFKTKHFIGTDNHLASVDIGKFAEGTKIDFGIDNGVGGFYRTGGAAANPDNFDHTQVVKTANAVNVSFEDFKNGGDRDFNDALIRVRSSAPATATANASATDLPTLSNGNRSGLADGTNPGAGAGTKNASNGGTANPAGVKIATGTVSLIAAPIPVKLAAEVSTVAAQLPTVKLNQAPGRGDVGKAAISSDNGHAAKTATTSAIKPLAVTAAPAQSAVLTSSAAGAPVPSARLEVIDAKHDTGVTAAASGAGKPIIVAEATPKASATLVQKITTLPPSSASVVFKADAAHTNRSGLGDGTNPGHGTASVKSLNQGVNNPGNAVAPVLK